MRDDQLGKCALFLVFTIKRDLTKSFASSIETDGRKIDRGIFFNIRHMICNSVFNISLSQFSKICRSNVWICYLWRI